jgi:hypothetical protein
LKFLNRKQKSLRSQIRRRKSKKGPAIIAAALDNIYGAMKGLRLINRFGFNLPKGSGNNEKISQLVEEYQIWEYHTESMDWVCDEMESSLASYNPSAELLYILQNSIDHSKE